MGEVMPLTPEDVSNKRFTPVRLREGYDMGEVDQFLDEVESELDRLNKENDDLRNKLAAAQLTGGFDRLTTLAGASFVLILVGFSAQRVLVDIARRRRAQRRGGPTAVRVPLDAIEIPAAGHLISAGGKRLRPALALCSAYAAKGVGPVSDDAITGAQRQIAASRAERRFMSA